jgi:16S rRNA G966 N2-methylase RsmD
VDRSKDAVRVIEENASKTRLAENCSIRQVDCLDFIRRNRGKKYDIVFLDPPYASGLYQPVLRALLESDMLKATSMILCESDTEELFRNDPELATSYTIQKSSRYSKTVITVLSPVPSEE